MSTAEACVKTGPSSLHSALPARHVHVLTLGLPDPRGGQCMFHAHGTGLGKAHDVTGKQNGLGQFGLSRLSGEPAAWRKDEECDDR